MSASIPLLSTLRSMLEQPDGRRAFLRIWTIVFGAAFIGYSIYYYLSTPGLVDPTGRPYGRDFMAFFVASDIFLKHGATATYDTDLFRQFVSALSGEPGTFIWPYPPHALFFYAPIALLPYKLAYAVWYAAQLALLFTIVHFSRTLRGQWQLYLIAAPAVLYTIFAGQNGLLSGALMLGAFAWRKDIPWLSGVFLALLTYKPQLGILFPLLLLAEKRWATIAWGALFTALLIGLSVLLFGVESWRGFIATGISTQANATAQHIDFLYTAMPTLFMSARILGLSPDLSMALQLILALCIAVTFTRAAWKGSNAEPCLLALLASGTMLATPYAFNHDMVLVMIALLALWQAANDKPLPVAHSALIFAIWFLPTLVVILNRGLGIPLSPVLLGGFYILLLRIRHCFP